MQDTQELTDVPAAEAFEVTGFQAAVSRPRFGNAHQQYFTPRWLCEAMRPIAEHVFGFDGLTPEDRPRLNVLDPTCGAARLLVPFQEAGHAILGIELDDRLAEVAARAVGKRAVRQARTCKWVGTTTRGVVRRSRAASWARSRT